MKLIFSTLFLAILIVSCQPPADNSANEANVAIEAFEKNSKVALAQIEGWENESMDYDAVYASNALVRPTAYNSPDSITLDQMKKSDAEMWAAFDFDLLNDPVFLPGVDVETKQADGSVRYYGVWQVTLPATDSTEARSGEIKFYESFDFNDEGKIIYQQGYGDFGGLMADLMSNDEEASAEEASEEVEETAAE